MSSYYSSSPRSVSSVLSIEFRQVGRLRRVAMSGCQRCLECGCLAVSDVLCADVWLSAMSCVRMSGCQRCLVCGCLAVIDVLCATGDCVLKQRSQPAAVSIPLFNFLTIAYILWSPISCGCRVACREKCNSGNAGIVCTAMCSSCCGQTCENLTPINAVTISDKLNCAIITG